MSAARRFCIEFCEVCCVKMNAEAELSNFDTERFIVEVHSRIALWDMTTEAYSNRDLKKKSWEELVDIFMNQEDATDAEKNEYGRFAFLIISILFILYIGQIRACVRSV